MSRTSAPPSGSELGNEFSRTVDAGSRSVVSVYGRANGTATAGSDYTPLAATTVTFAAGETTKAVTVTITVDLVVESNETFSLGLSAAVGATISDTGGLATIVNDD